jgi:hypothetical protein
MEMWAKVFAIKIPKLEPNGCLNGRIKVKTQVWGLPEGYYDRM